MSDQLLRTLIYLEKDLRAESPALAQILDDLKAQRITSEEALKWVTVVAKEDTNVGTALERAASKLTETHLMAHNPTNRMPRLNPLYEAALIERAQFDGDIPEARQGPLPVGIAPAVPVKTDARSPIAVGRMLASAAAEMQQQIRQHENIRVKAIAASVEGLQQVAKHGALLVQQSQKEDVALMLHGSPETDHPEYRRGQLPALYTAVLPTGKELSGLTKKEAQEATWATIATSQGRRSATPMIRDGVRQRLTKAGFTIRMVETPIETTPPASTATWMISIAARDSLQPNFSFFDMASMALAAELLAKLQEKTPRGMRLEVTPAAKLTDRVVGWCGKLFEEV